jgi:hypothetical protein
MPPKRSSKRLLGEEPSAEKVTKRARKPNANTLDAFSTKQVPVRKQNTGKRKGTKLRKLPKDDLPPEKLPATPIAISSTSGGLPGGPPAPSSPIQLTPVLARKRANAPPPSSPFDPNNEGKIPHNVTLMITPIIDGSRKSDAGICTHLNINDIFRDDLETLNAYVYKKYVKQWEDIRKLTPGEKPRWSHWNVTIGNPKGQYHTLRVDDAESWKNVEITLRQIEKDGGPSKKYAHKIEIDSIYTSFDRLITPPPQQTTVSRGKSKARPDTVRRTNLEATPEYASGGDEDEDEDDDGDSNDLDLPPVYGRGRSSATTRQLKEKRSRDASLPKQQYHREQLFARTRCTRDGCSNGERGGTGNCFVLKQRNSHHKLSQGELDEWSELIGVDDITLNIPPPDWIISYIAGTNECTNKRRSRKKEEKTIAVEDMKEETPAPPLTAPQPPALMQYPYPPQPLPPPGYYAPQPQYYAPPPVFQYRRPPPTYGEYYDAEYNHYVAPPRPRHPNPPRPQPPSSPIREPYDEELTGFSQYILGQEEEDDDRTHIQHGLDILQRKRIKVEDLIHTQWIMNVLHNEGVRIDICSQMQRAAKEFKALWKQRRDAAQGLAQMGQAQYQGGGSTASSYRQEFMRVGEDKTAGFFDNY